MTEKKEEKVLIDTLKPALEAEVPEIAPEMMEMVHIGDLAAQLIKDEGIDHVFGLTAGGIWMMETLVQRAGIKRVHVRHEQTATFAADAWGRLTRRPGVALIGPGTGLTNSTTGVVQGYSAQSPMVVIVGESGSIDDDKPGAQGLSRSENQFQGISKWARKVHTPIGFLFQLKRAFRSAVTPPQGPCVVAYGYDFLYFRERVEVPRMMAYMFYHPTCWTPRVWRTCEDPELVRRALAWLLEAEKPAMIVGESIHQDDAQDELREFVELLGIPCHARRISRGAISEYDPLNAYGRARGRVMRGADRALIMGLRIGYLENDGNPPFWGAQTRYIQAQTCPENVCLTLDTEYELIGNMKMLLRQLIECARDMGIKGPLEKWASWRQFVVDTKEEYFRKTMDRTEKMRGQVPLHPDLVGRLVSEFLRDELNDDYITCIDGFTASSFFTDWNRVKRSGQVLDAAETIGIGHGPGLAIGAGLATNRNVPILVVMGDGAVGAGGMDIETAARWNIPAVFLHENNDTMVTGGWNLFLSKACSATGNRMLDSWETLPGIRYDRIFKEFGCYTEFVEKDPELKPALKRAFDYVKSESKPAFVEVFVDPNVLQEIWGQSLTPVIGSILPWDEIPEEGQRAVFDWNLVPPAQLLLLHPSWQEVIVKKMMGGG